MSLRWPMVFVVDSVMTKNSSKTIKTIAGDFKNYVELKSFCEDLYKAHEKLLEENKLLRSQLGEVESQSSFLTDSLITNEERICLVQIEKLREDSEKRKLSLEEIKMLDLLNKNLRLIRGESTSNLSRGKDVTNTKSLSTLKLMEIASSAGKEKDK